MEPGLPLNAGSGILDMQACRDVYETKSGGWVMFSLVMLYCIFFVRTCSAIRGGEEPILFSRTEEPTRNGGMSRIKESIEDGGYSTPVLPPFVPCKPP